MCAAITDLAGLRYWAHPGVDLHFVTHPESIEEVEKLVGPGSVEWMRPPILREFLMPRTRRDAREALDVPAHTDFQHSVPTADLILICVKPADAPVPDSFEVLQFRPRKVERLLLAETHAVGRISNDDPCQCRRRDL